MRALLLTAIVMCAAGCPDKAGEETAAPAHPLLAAKCKAGTKSACDELDAKCKDGDQPACELRKEIGDKRSIPMKPPPGGTASPAP